MEDETTDNVFDMLRAAEPLSGAVMVSECRECRKHSTAEVDVVTAYLKHHHAGNDFYVITLFSEELDEDEHVGVTKRIRMDLSDGPWVEAEWPHTHQDGPVWGQHAMQVSVNRCDELFESVRLEANESSARLWALS